MAATDKRGLILCPGPSLAAALPLLRSGGAGEFDLSVAVNRAAKSWPADYWSILDAESFDDVDPIGRPTLIIGERGKRQLLRKHPSAIADFGVVLREDLASPPRATRWYRWTATVAVVAAWGFGCRRIVVYGADLAGLLDFDGVKLDRQHRNKRRWIRERDAWQRVAAWLAGQGIALTRVAAERPSDRKLVAASGNEGPDA